LYVLQTNCRKATEELASS